MLGFFVVVKWKVLYTKRAREDSFKLKECGLDKKTKQLLKIVSENPYQNPPPFEKLTGLVNVYSRRINLVHRLVYEIQKDESTVIIRMMFKHYGD